jgi:hypothetical protein
MTAKYRFGRLVSKYIIFDIFGHAGYREEIGSLLMRASRSLRNLLR